MRINAVVPIEGFKGFTPRDEYGSADFEKRDSMVVNPVVNTADTDGGALRETLFTIEFRFCFLARTGAGRNCVLHCVIGFT